MRGTALLALQGECDELPLELRRRRQQLQYASKVKTVKNHPTKMVLEDHWTQYYGGFEETSEPLACKIKEFFDSQKHRPESTRPSEKAPWLRAPTYIDTSLSKVINKQDPPDQIKACALELMERYEGQLAIYTDGSKSVDGRVSSAFTVPELKVKVNTRITDDLTVYTSELVAIKLALEWIIQVNDDLLPPGRDVVIYSDSLSSLMSLETGSSSSRPNLVQDILNLIDSIVCRKITLTWVPAHVAIRGNEVADQLAKEALETEQVLQVGFELKETLQEIDRYIRGKWQAWWSSTTKGKFYRDLFPLVNSHNGYENRSREKEVKVIRLRLGKCRLNYYLHKIKRHPTGKCDTCLVDETIEHYLLECEESKIKYKLKDICIKYCILFDLGEVLRSTRILEEIYPLLQREL